MSAEGELDGQVAVVTGGAGGIGRATAMRLCSAGASVSIWDRRPEPGRRTVDEICSRGGTAELQVTDVSDAAQVERAAEAVRRRFGGVDILVNNAGVMTMGDVWRTDEELWDQIMGVNVKGMFLVARALLPALARRPGAIVNVASVQAAAAVPGSVAYITSKHAVLGLTRALARDHAPVRVNCVGPGTVDTGHSTPESLEAWGRLHTLGRVAQPEEIAEVIAFLAGPRASFVTGAFYPVDGGMLARVR